MSSLNVQMAARVLGQDAVRVARAEVLPVQQRIREQAGGHADVGVDQLVVALVPDPRVPVARVHILGQQGRVVGARVQDDRDDPARMQAGRGDVDGELPHRDLDAAHPPVADAQDALGVGGDDQVHVLGSQPVIAEGGLDLAGMIHRQEHPAGTAELIAVSLDGRPDGGGVDDRQHLGDVLGQQPVEQHLVAVPQAGQVQVLGQVIGLAEVLPVDPPQLSLDGRHALGQQAGQPERLPLGEGERRAPVQCGRGQQRGTTQPDPRHHALRSRDQVVQTFRHLITHPGQARDTYRQEPTVTVGLVLEEEDRTNPVARHASASPAASAAGSASAADEVSSRAGSRRRIPGLREVSWPAWPRGAVDLASARRRPASASRAAR